MDPANENNPEAKARGYIYASLAFCSVLCKAEADILHLWIGRRASTRIRSELMASIYAKALVRKNYSGIIDKKDGRQGNHKDGKSTLPTTSSQSNTSTKSKAEEGQGDPKYTSGADVGKIVQLMSGDANSIAQFFSLQYFIYVGFLRFVCTQPCSALTSRCGRPHHSKSS